MFKKIATNTIAQILSKAATAVISIFLINILTNYLSIELYGLYSKIYNYLGIFAFIADLGLYTIAVREITNNKSDSSKIVGNIMTLRLLLGIFIIILSLLIAYFLPGYNYELAMIGIFIAGFFTLISLFNSSILALMQAHMKMEYSLFSAITGKLFNIGFIILIVYFLFSKQDIRDLDIPFILIFISGLIGISINTGLNYRYANKKISSFFFKFDWEYIKFIFKTSLPYGIALFLSVVYFKVDIILLSLLESKDNADISIALYSLPMKIVEVVMVMGGFYLNSILPSLTRDFEDNNKKRIKKVFSISFKILFAFGTLVFLLGSLFRNHVIKIIANESYLSPNHIYNSSEAFLIVLLVVLFYFISLLFIYIFIASKNQSKLLKINIFITIFNIIGNIILIPKYSFIGAGIITVLSQIILMVLGYYYSKDIIRVKIPVSFIIKVLIIFIILFFGGSFLINNYPLGLYYDILFYGFLFFIIYLLLIKLLIKNLRNIGKTPS
ncbi:hypothetical protein CSB07_00725 [Candidatus Gracilibacteria bacterium]|nr:MAG: hypothetical protein CSB07_00725 [Candidatus Gracilibacteria bacterium]PIE85024.1 MAG: hypothetical protein CSA08_04250 [Candidatus Gracilibacteria bacterium]